MTTMYRCDVCGEIVDPPDALGLNGPFAYEHESHTRGLVIGVEFRDDTGREHMCLACMKEDIVLMLEKKWGMTIGKNTESSEVADSPLRQLRPGEPVSESRPFVVAKGEWCPNCKYSVTHEPGIGCISPAIHRVGGSAGEG